MCTTSSNILVLAKLHCNKSKFSQFHTFVILLGCVIESLKTENIFFQLKIDDPVPNG